jgi:hypothetical protein
MTTNTYPSKYSSDSLDGFYNSDVPFGAKKHADHNWKPDPKLNQGAVGCGFPPINEQMLKPNTIANPQEVFAKHDVTYGFVPTAHPEDWRAGSAQCSVGLPPKPNTNTSWTRVDHEVAVKHDQDKTDWSLMPFECVEEINKVLDFGAKKYAAHNWRTGSGFSYTRVISSLLRHTFAWIRGEDLDPESGLSHLSHMGCNVIFLIYYNKHKDRYNNDDRVKS